MSWNEPERTHALRQNENEPDLPGLSETNQDELE
jgi:hypothetical protein